MSSISSSNFSAAETVLLSLQNVAVRAQLVGNGEGIVLRFKQENMNHPRGLLLIRCGGG